MSHSKEFLQIRLHGQKAHEWDLEQDIHWQKGIDLDAILLPVGENFALVPDATPREKLVISQAMGLLAIGGISEHESVLGEQKFYAQAI